MRFWRLLTRAWRDRPRLRPQRGIRALTIDSRAKRLGRIAERERITVEELEDAIQLLAAQHPATMDQVLDVVDAHGLHGAGERLEDLARGGPWS